MTGVQPMFFGPDDSLFGVYHPALGTRRDHAIIIAAPLLNEYLRTYNTLAQVARSLAEAGFDVFRFDYFGTGSSKGAVESAHFSDWSDNLVTAVDTVVSLGNSSKKSVIAVRFAANLAATLTHSRTIDSLVLWDPVFEGLRWKESVRNGQQDFVNLYPKESALDGTEIMGYVTAPGFLDELNDFEVVDIKAQKIDAVITDNYADTESIERLSTSVTNVKYDCRWDDMDVPVMHSRDIVSAVCRVLL